MTPHPRRDPRGYLHGQRELPAPALVRASWRKSHEFLRGFDLFNRGYPWEAHEAWESVWSSTKVADPLAAIAIQALIQAAAAAVQEDLGNSAGAVRLATAAADKFARIGAVLGPRSRLLGFVPMRLAARLRRAAARPASLARLRLRPA